MIRRLALPFALLTLSACASRPLAPTPNCAQRDWYEIGRRDGAQGAPEDRVEHYLRECRGSLNAHDAAIYVNGRNAGLVEYCQPDSAYQAGRAGQPYLNVCPPPIEPAFLASYRRGQRARAVEQRSRDLDAEIEVLSSRLLRAGDPVQQRRMSTQLNLLRRARARADRELDAVRR